MFVLLFLLICAGIYIYRQRTRIKDFEELQQTIALLQEQIQLFEGIEKRVSKVEKAGIELVHINELKSTKEENTNDNDYISILSRAYFAGSYLLSFEQRKKIESIRKDVEGKIPW